MTLLKTALYETHLELKAKMGPFAGYAMPLQYSSSKEEVKAVRENAGVFDVSHMGEFFVEGPDAKKFVSYLLPAKVDSTPIGKALYSPLCNHEAKILDDLIIYNLAQEKILICVNASNMNKDWEWINKIAEEGDFDIKLKNVSEQTSLLALQGPKAFEILADANIPSPQGYYQVTSGSFQGEDIIVSSTGYTGEKGVEIFCPHHLVKIIWSLLLKKGAAPCGLVARDILRTEVAYPLYGHELSQEWTPLEANLKWAIDMSKDFVGKTALEGHTRTHKLVKLTIEKGIPRDGYPVFQGEKQVGTVRSGTFSYTLSKGIAIALVEASTDVKGDFSIEMRGRKTPAVYSKSAFVTQTSLSK